MPIYQYYEILPDGMECESEPFDVSQKINGPTLEVNKITGSPIKKYLSATSINTQYSEKKTKNNWTPQTFSNKASLNT